jgi:HD superfamily phosphohydrolase
MVDELDRIPELQALDARWGLIRIPPELDVPLTRRVRRLIDTREFRRLARISQLGLVGHIYPGATHTRFEHSLGVYRMALLYLRRLAFDDRFRSLVTPRDAQRFVAAALLHDLGHWPFCHAIEDMQLAGVPQHELLANSFLLEGEVADVLRHDWGLQPREVMALISGEPRDGQSLLLSSMLSGPIDVDKIDYLMRDSLHAGVPYGRNFDQDRLIGSLCVNAAGDGLAVTDKGRTAAEMMVFSRYVMFSEVYWHHAVRAASAMLQRAFYLLHPDIDLDWLFRLSEHDMIQHLMQKGEGGPAADLLDGLFGSGRRLYKRLEQFTIFHHPKLYRRLARRSYPLLVACGEHLAASLSRRLGRRVAPHEILFDAPPVKLEVQFQVDVFFPKEDRYRPLGEVSPVVRTLATRQFDDYVKRVRIYCHPSLADELRGIEGLVPMVQEALEVVDST